MSTICKHGRYCDSKEACRQCESEERAEAVERAQRPLKDACALIVRLWAVKHTEYVQADPDLADDVLAFLKEHGS